MARRSAGQCIDGIGSFRKPDFRGVETRIWYGPGGRDGDHATTVRESFKGNFHVCQFDGLAGYGFKGPNGEMFRKICTQVKARTAREAACKGTQSIAEFGGNEGYASTLP